MKFKNRFLQVYYEKHYLFSLILILISILILSFCLNKYLIHVNKEASKIKDNTESSFTLNKKEKLKNNMYLVNLADDLDKSIKNKKQTTVTYKIKGENFYFDVRIARSKKSCSYDIIKVVDNLHNVTAKIDYQNVVKMEYMTDPKGEATVIKFITNDDAEFLAITDETYYFLGEDIDDISFENDEFHYKAVNPKYDNKELIKSGCTQKVINDIEDFDFNESYYYIGRINFLNDYYQKTVDTTSSVEEKCKEVQK